MKKSQVRVSLVIPVYNEESHLAFCLDSIAALTVKPYEVIVVDNNSADQTIAIARRYPFVRLIHEPRQGVVFARDAGFNAAQGEIIGRIDADTLLPRDWIATVQGIFAATEAAAISGKIHYYDQAFAGAGDKIDNFCRRHLAHVQARSRSVFLQGANLAMRRDAWIAVRDDMCHLDGIHEDFDLAIHLQQKGFRVDFDERLEAAISSRRIDSDIITFTRYLLVCPRTYAFHHRPSRTYLYLIGLLWLLMYLPAYVGYRAYDPALGKFTLERLLSSRVLHPRVDPSAVPSE